MKTTMAALKSDREAAATALRNNYHLTPGKAIYVNVNHVTENGTRYLDIYTVMDGGTAHERITRITFTVALVTGFTYNRRREAIRTQNAALDVVAVLGRRLYGDARAFGAFRLA